jgi:hypothetical protein
MTLASGALLAAVACGGTEEPQGYNQSGEFELTFTNGQLEQAVYSTVQSDPALPPGTIRAATTRNVIGPDPGPPVCPAGQQCFQVTITNNLGATAIGLYMGIDSITPKSGRDLVNPDPAPPGVSAPLGGRMFGNIPQGGSVTRDLNFTIPNLSSYVVRGRYWVDSGVVSQSFNGPTVPVTGVSQYGQAIAPVTFSAGDFQAGALVRDVNVTVNFRKVGGTCTNPGTSNARHNQTSLQLRGPTGAFVNLARSSAPTTYAGSTDVGSVSATFDQDSANVLTPGQLPFSGTYRPAVGNLDTFDGLTPFGNWQLFAGTNISTLCIESYTVTVLAF